MRKGNSSNFVKSMFRYSMLLIIVLITVQCSNTTKIFKATFTQESPEVVVAVKDLNPNLPSNWESYKFLNVVMRISTPQFFNFGFITKGNYYYNRISTFSDTWVRMSIPLDFYRGQQIDGDEMASLWGKPRVTGKMSTYGDAKGPLDAVDSIKISIKNKLLSEQTIEIRSIELTNEDIQEIISPKVLVDKFGQWKNEEWSGKVHSDKELEEAWKKNDSLTLNHKVERDIYGGFLNTSRKATGFFRIEKIDGKWWFVNPLGHLSLVTGVNGVRYVKYEYTPTHGRQYIYEELPPEEFTRPSFWKYKEPDISFTQWNLNRRYGSSWKEDWSNFTVKRMHTWGLNMTNWSDTTLQEHIPYAEFLWGWGVQGAPLGIPDVYSDNFENLLDSLADIQCTPVKNNPWVIGYFTGNEPIWPGRESLAVDAILKGKDTKTKKVLEQYLAKGDTPERRIDFIVDTYTKYLKMVKKAILKYDPNHLILGTRLGGEPSEEAIRLANIFDAVSVNVYSNGIPKEFLDHIYDISEKPIFIGEFHMGTYGRGMAPGLIQVKDEEQRGVGYQYYVETAFAHPAVIGTTWYKWRDEICTGHEYGSNYNIGFIDVTDKAYPKLINHMIDAHNRIFKVHSGDLKPYDVFPEGGQETNYIE